MRRFQTFPPRLGTGRFNPKPVPLPQREDFDVRDLARSAEPRPFRWNQKAQDILPSIQRLRWRTIDVLPGRSVRKPPRFFSYVRAMARRRTDPQQHSRIAFVLDVRNALN
jgi:hypothetical protein